MRSLWLLAILLTGCASLPPAPAAHPTLSTPFALNGRIAVNHQGERHSAGLRWTHSTQSDEILLLTPIGQTAARVYRDVMHATLDDGDQHYQAVDAETLMQQVLGWYLPMNGLHHWVLGLADGVDASQIERDAHNQIVVLHQNGWEIRYLRYADTRQDSLPTRLQLSHDDLQIVLLIDEWELP